MGSVSANKPQTGYPLYVYGVPLPPLLFLASCTAQGDPKNDLRTFRMAVSSEPPTLDWSLATDSISIRVIDNLMEGLTQFDHDLNPG